MVCLGLEPGAAGWKAQTNPLSYGGTPKNGPYFRETIKNCNKLQKISRLSDYLNV